MDPGRSQPGGRHSGSSLRHLDVEAHLRDPGIKQAFVTPMFDLIAPRYDAFTRRFSFGMDAAWKAALVARAAQAIPEGGHCLDVACGTGDLALAVARARPDVSVTGIDASAPMLALAEARRLRAALPNVNFAAGDLARLDAPPASVDAITAGYALRNVPSWRESLGELARVARPGAHLLTLDFYRPEHHLWGYLFLRYLAAAGWLYGWLWHREPVAYGYIARSIAHHVTASGFAAGLAEAGFRPVGERRWLGGGIVMHHAARA